jgi:hypothetical protein
MNDATNSLSRIYQNNFRDADRQAVIDLVLGMKGVEETRLFFNLEDVQVPTTPTPDGPGGDEVGGGGVERPAMDNPNQPLPLPASRRGTAVGALSDGVTALSSTLADQMTGISSMGKYAMSGIASGLGSVFGGGAGQPPSTVGSELPTKASMPSSAPVPAVEGQVTPPPAT